MTILYYRNIHVVCMISQYKSTTSFIPYIEAGFDDVHVGNIITFQITYKSMCHTA